MTEELNQILAACNYEISDGTRYMWDCYGKAAHIIEFDFGDHAAAEVVFSRDTQKVFEVTVWYEDARSDAYRWIDPVVRADYDAEAAEKGVNPNEAWEGVLWQDLDSFSELVAILTDIADEPDAEMQTADVELFLDEKSWALIEAAARVEGITVSEFMLDAVNDRLKKTMSGLKLV